MSLRPCEFPFVTHSQSPPLIFLPFLHVFMPNRCILNVTVFWHTSAPTPPPTLSSGVIAHYGWQTWPNVPNVKMSQPPTPFSISACPLDSWNTDRMYVLAEPRTRTLAVADLYSSQVWISGYLHLNPLRSDQEALIYAFCTQSKCSYTWYTFDIIIFNQCLKLSVLFCYTHMQIVHRSIMINYCL
jgi:hypothetical protein